MHSLASPPLGPGDRSDFGASHLVSDEIGALRRERDRLAEECQQLRALIDSVPEYLYTKDLDGRYVVNNRTNLTLLGEDDEAAVAGRTVFDLFPHEIAEIYHADDRRVLETGVAVVDRPEPFVTPEGEARWYWTTKVPIRGREGEIRGLAGVSRDVTDHLRALDTLATREEELRLALSAARFGIWNWDSESNFLHLSPEILALLGYDPTEHDGRLRSLLAWVHPDDREALMELVARVKAAPTLNSRVELTCRFLAQDGQTHWLAASGEAHRFSDGKLASIRGVALDVTERNRALLEAQRQETDLRLALGAAQMGIWIYTAADDSLTLSLEIWVMLGVEPRPLVTSDWLLEWVHPEDREDWQAKYRAVLLEPITDSCELDFIDHQYRIVTSAGVTRWVHARGRVERDADGWATGVRGVVLDITEPRQAEEALRESEERYRALVDVCPDAIYVCVGGNVAFANRACTELFGAPEPSDLVGRNYTELFHPDELSEIANRRVLSLQTGTPQPLVQERIRRLDGGQRLAEVTAAPFTYQGGRALQIVLRDITERKSLQEQLWQSQRLETVGRLAGGVAHDFNNLLTAIIGYADLGEMAAPEDGASRHYIQGIREAAERAAGLTQQLLAFARKQVIATQEVDANDLLLRADPFLRRLLEENITLTSQPSREVCRVRVDPAQIEQVLLNLAINARDAMPEGGALELRVEKAIVPAEGFPEEVMPGSYVHVTVADTGTGIPADVQPHVFEPFFTTKEWGKGTGLGLATAYGIVHQHGGRLWFETTPGTGTVFHLLLPALSGDDPDANLTLKEAVSFSAGATNRGSGTLLIVEDEEMVRSFASLSLRALGYEVLEARDGIEALQVLSDVRGKVDLVLADVMMPRMGGVELARQVRAQYPELKLLLASGYSDGVLPHDGLADGLPFISKPYTAGTLAGRIAEQLRT